MDTLVEKNKENKKDQTCTAKLAELVGARLFRPSSAIKKWKQVQI